MSTATATVPTSARFIEVIAQSITNPVVMKAGDFMIGMIVDVQGNPKHNVKELNNNNKYFFLAYDESTSKTNISGLPKYSELPKYIVSFNPSQFKDKTTENVFTGLRAIINAASTIMDLGFFSQDQMIGKVIGEIEYKGKQTKNAMLYISSYVVDGQTAFIMTTIED
jgi:hypothetical protein